MSREREPVRWADSTSDCDPMLRRLIEGARDGLGDAALAARIERAVRERTAADSDVIEPTPAAARPRMWLPWVGVATLRLGVLAAGIWERQLVSNQLAPAPVSVPVQEPESGIGRGYEPAAAHSGAEVGPKAGALEARPGSTDPVKTARRSAAPQESARAPTLDPQRLTAQHASRAVSAPDVEGGSLMHSRGRMLAPAQSAVPPELSLISAAQRALRTAPAEALALADQHAQAYPSGRFSEEREEIAISAQWALGEHAAARTRARAFLTRYPRALAAPRMARLLDAAF